MILSAVSFSRCSQLGELLYATHSSPDGKWQTLSVVSQLRFKLKATLGPFQTAGQCDRSIIDDTIEEGKRANKLSNSGEIL